MHEKDISMRKNAWKWGNQIGFQIPVTLFGAMVVTFEFGSMVGSVVEFLLSSSRFSRKNIMNKRIAMAIKRNANKMLRNQHQIIFFASLRDRQTTDPCSISMIVKFARSTMIGNVFAICVKKKENNKTICLWDTCTNIYGFYHLKVEKISILPVSTAKTKWQIGLQKIDKDTMIKYEFL